MRSVKRMLAATCCAITYWLLTATVTATQQPGEGQAGKCRHTLLMGHLLPIKSTPPTAHLFVRCSAAGVAVKCV